MRALMVIAAAVAVVIAGSAVAEDQSRTGDPLAIASLEESIALGMLPAQLRVGKARGIPNEVTENLTRCYVRLLVSKVDTADPKLWDGSQESMAKMLSQMLGGLTPSLLDGNDAVAASCPSEAEAYRSHL